MTIETPCSTGDPNDWFIEKDGKQYRDDEVLTIDELHEIALVANDWKIVELHSNLINMIDNAEGEKTRVMLIRRRKARDACYECPIRAACLGQRLEAKVEFGIWGGYYPEELRKIEDTRDERLRRRGGVD